MPERLIATHRRAVIVTIALALSMFAAFALATWSVYSNDQHNCDSRNQILGIVAAIIRDSRKEAIQDPFIAGQRLAQAINFYDMELARIDAALC